MSFDSTPSSSFQRAAVGLAGFAVGLWCFYQLKSGTRRTQQQQQELNTPKIIGTTCAVDRHLICSGSSSSSPNLSSSSVPLEIHLLLHNISKPRNLSNALNCATALGVDKIVLVGQRKNEICKSISGSSNGVHDGVGGHKSRRSSPLTKIETFKYFNQALAAYGKPKLRQIPGTDRVVVVDEKAELEADASPATSAACDNSSKVPEAAAAQQSKKTTVGSCPSRHSVVFIGLEIVKDSVDCTTAIGTVRKEFPDCRTVVLVPGNEGTGMSALERAACDMFMIVRQECRFATFDQETNGGGGAGSMNVNTALAVALQQLLARR